MERINNCTDTQGDVLHMSDLSLLLKVCIQFIPSCVLSFLFVQFGHLRNISVGNHAYEKTGLAYTPLSLCQESYRNGSISPANETFDIDAQVDIGNGLLKTLGAVCLMVCEGVLFMSFHSLLNSFSIPPLFRMCGNIPSGPLSTGIA